MTLKYKISIKNCDQCIKFAQKQYKPAYKIIKTAQKLQNLQILANNSAKKWRFYDKSTGQRRS